jgi:UDP-sulfoquinovose synthase
VRCIALAIKHPPARKERVKIFNQATETHRIQDLADLVSRLTGAEVRYYINPRNEAWDNELVIHNEQFLELGLNPVRLSEGLLYEVYEVAARYRDRVDMSKIITDSRWRPEIPVDRTGSSVRFDTLPVY